jgi:hypothetical protein
MIQKAILSLAIILIAVSCSSDRGNGNISASGESPLLVSITEILSDPLEYDGKAISIEGVITHVCRHSGDKMRVMQQGSDLSLQIMLGDFTGRFDAESEGMPVKLTGLLLTEVTNLDELAHHTHEGESHECENTRQAVEVMKARGLDPRIRTYLALNHYE